MSITAIQVDNYTLPFKTKAGYAIASQLTAARTLAEIRSVMQHNAASFGGVAPSGDVAEDVATLERYAAIRWQSICDDFASRLSHCKSSAAVMLTTIDFLKVAAGINIKTLAQRIALDSRIEATDNAGKLVKSIAGIMGDAKA